MPAEADAHGAMRTCRYTYSSVVTVIFGFAGAVGGTVEGTCIHINHLGQAIKFIDDLNIEMWKPTPKNPREVSREC